MNTPDVGTLEYCQAKLNEWKQQAEAADLERAELLDRVIDLERYKTHAINLQNHLTTAEKERDDLKAEVSQLCITGRALLAKVETYQLRLTRLANQAAVLCVHCDGFKDGGLGAFATAREFTKDEIRLAREVLPSHHATERNLTKNK